METPRITWVPPKCFDTFSTMRRSSARSIAPKAGCTTETLRRWVRQAERDQGRAPQPAGRLAGSLGLEGEGAPGAVELLGPTRACEGLQWVQREALYVRVERRERPRDASDIARIGLDVWIARRMHVALRPIQA